jgi:hypothetical protein
MIISSVCPKITILGEAIGPDRLDQFKYERRVTDVLDTMASMRVGMAILDEINAGSRQITFIPTRSPVRPNAAAGPRGSFVDTGQSPVDVVKAITKKGTPILVPVPAKKPSDLNLKDCKQMPLRINGKTVRGTGTGVDEMVEFSPSDWTGQSNFPADVILAHELTHALRAMKGIMERRATCNLYDTTEEIPAIFMENIYRSECRKNGRQVRYRWHHHGFVEMPATLADPVVYFRANKKMIWKFMKEMPRMATMLMDIRDLEFNPLESKCQLDGT